MSKIKYLVISSVVVAALAATPLVISQKLTVALKPTKLCLKKMVLSKIF